MVPLRIIIEFSIRLVDISKTFPGIPFNHLGALGIAEKSVRTLFIYSINRGISGAFPGRVDVHLIILILNHCDCLCFEDIGFDVPYVNLSSLGVPLQNISHKC